MTYDVKPLEGFHPELGLLLATLRDSTREWREYLETPPVEAIVWQPYPNGYSIGALHLHLIECESWWFEQVICGKAEDPEEAKLLMSSEIDQDNNKWPMPHAQPIDWYYELHDRIRTRAWEGLRQQDPERILQPHRSQLSVRWILAHVVEHDAYTGGQAVLMHEMWKATQGK